ncbi:MAG: hypothetical protein WC102_10260, partial [Saccharofermentanales bacterium]
SPSTAYKAYIIVEDGDGNISDIAVISFTTADEEQPNEESEDPNVAPQTGDSKGVVLLLSLILSCAIISSVCLFFRRSEVPAK